MRLLLLTATGIVFASLAIAQAPTQRLQFEVASIRPARPPGPDPDNEQSGLQIDGSQARFSDQTIRNLIARAYDIQAGQVRGPEWIGSLRFDIDAKLPDGSTVNQVPKMLQSLLADRFGLKIHLEPKEMSAYALILGKQPLRLQESSPDSEPSNTQGTVSVAASGSRAGVAMNLQNGGSYTFADNQFQFHRVSMDLIALNLARYLDRPVVNMTGLKGLYDLTLNVTEDDYYILLVRLGSNAGVALPPQSLSLLSASPVSLFDALDQHGLHMDARKLPLDQIVVDHVLQTPTEN